MFEFRRTDWVYDVEGKILKHKIDSYIKIQWLNCYNWNFKKETETEAKF